MNWDSMRHLKVVFVSRKDISLSGLLFLAQWSHSQRAKNVKKCKKFARFLNLNFLKPWLSMPVTRNSSQLFSSCHLEPQSNNAKFNPELANVRVHSFNTILWLLPAQPNFHRLKSSTILVRWQFIYKLYTKSKQTMEMPTITAV